MITQDYDFFQCTYTLETTQRYLEEIVCLNYSEVERTEIFKGLALAQEVHKVQVRCDNLPFIIHPMRVALMLTRFDGKIASKVFIAALLHDTIEDTYLSYREIEDLFGLYVAKLVSYVSRRHDTKSLQEKCEAKIQNWRQVMLNSHEVRAIKTFEDLDNIICWKAIPRDSIDQKKIPRWLTEAHELSLPLARATNLQVYRIMQQEIAYYDRLGYGLQPITL